MKKISFVPARRGGLLALAAILLGCGLAALWLGGGRAAGGEVFLVASSGDASDDAKGDCLCHTSGGPCTLRAAIEEANACPGGQTIRFQYYEMKIKPAAALPAITGHYTVIDGSDRLMAYSGVIYPSIEIDGQNGNFIGLVITSTHNAVYGLQIHHFNQHGLYLYDDAAYNQIGGLGPGQRNIISANAWNGVYIYGSQAVSNTVSGNYIGLNALGAGEPFGSILFGLNGHHGVSVWYGDKNVVADNWIAGSGWSGVAVDQAEDVRIRHNHIGLDVDLLPEGNSFYGVHVANSAAPKVHDNLIAHNARGVLAEGGSQPIIQDNHIYSNTAMALSPPNGGGILFRGAGTYGWITDNQIHGNSAAYGAGIAVQDGAHAAIYRNLLEGNGFDSTGDFQGGGAGIYLEGGEGDIRFNQILSNVLAGDMGANTSFFGGGIYLLNMDYAYVQRNVLRGNYIQAKIGGGSGIGVLGGEKILIHGNQVEDNYFDGIAGGGSGIYLYNFSEPSHFDLDRNWIAYNGGSPALLVSYETHFTLTNNIIAHNSGDGLFMYYVYSATVANNNTIADNGGSGIDLESSTMYLKNSILANNHHYGLEVHYLFSPAQLNNDVWSNAWGPSNVALPFYMELDPRFFDSAAGSYALRPNSPCLDQADACSYELDSYNGLPRPQGSGADIGAFEMAQRYLPMLRK
jgi:CSLREA domain-containing protein